MSICKSHEHNIKTGQLLCPAASLSVDELLVCRLLLPSNSPPSASEFPLEVEFSRRTSDGRRPRHAPRYTNKGNPFIMIRNQDQMLSLKTDYIRNIHVRCSYYYGITSTPYLIFGSKCCFNGRKQLAYLILTIRCARVDRRKTTPPTHLI